MSRPLNLTDELIFQQVEAVTSRKGGAVEYPETAVYDERAIIPWL